MAVYVDQSCNRLGRMVMCHMIADTLDELHAMAGRIGMRREWFQSPPAASFPHYDVALGRRADAVRYGARSLDRHQMIAKIRELRSTT